MRTSAITAPALTLAAALGLAVGCTPPERAEHDHLCYDDLAVIELLDITNSARDADLLQLRMESVREAAERVADCDGHLTVIAYGSSAAGHHELFADQLDTGGATEVARDRRINSLVADVMDEVRTELDVALASLQGDVSDPLAAYTVVADWASDQPPGISLEASFHSDMIATTGPLAINTPEPAVEEIVERIRSLNAPQLSGVAVRIRGVGRVSGDVQPPGDFVADVRTVAEASCAATRASCSLTTTE